MKIIMRNLVFATCLSTNSAHTRWQFVFFHRILPLANYMDWIVYKLHQTRLISANTRTHSAHTDATTHLMPYTNRTSYDFDKNDFYFGLEANLSECINMFFHLTFCQCVASLILPFFAAFMDAIHAQLHWNCMLWQATAAAAASAATLKTCKSCLTALLCFGIILVLGECKQ